MIRILCLCNWGNVRSVAMAKYIKMKNLAEGQHHWNKETCERKRKNDKFKYEAIAAGKYCNDENTLDILTEWADYIIDLSDDGEYCPGKDTWYTPTHPELINKLGEIWKRFTEKHHLE